MSKPQRHYPPNLFDTLCSPNSDVERVLGEFEDHLINNPHNARSIFQDLVTQERQEVVRLVLSHIDTNWILKDFPSAGEAFNNSCAQKILSQLSAYFLYTPTHLLDVQEEEREIGDLPDMRRVFYRQLVKDAPDVLLALKDKLSCTDSAPSTFKKMSQKQMKQARRAAAKANAPLDPAPFERLEIPVPETVNEIQKAIVEILLVQKRVLKDYLKALKGQELQKSLITACLIDQPISAPLPQLEVGVESASTILSQIATIAGSEDLYPVGQAMKLTALYNESATGFGEWAINISPRGERDLRDHRRRDRKIFKIILKKIQELSNGHFSPDNQKRLNNKQVDVPIYEAKMTSDLRLVYQIDCVPSYDTLHERQAIKIFGIYTHAQLGRVSFWDTMGRELGKKGKEYKDRCNFRKPPHHAGDHVFSPSIFPAPEEVRTMPTGCAPDLPPDDLEQIQSLLLKSVHFSQPLLNAILADLDVAFILQVSPREQDIIEHPHSCYVLGRSGTGKTTTMLYKMLLVEANHELGKQEGIEASKPRQLFVTQSRILSEKVQEHFSKLSAGYQFSPGQATKTTAAVSADLVDSDDDPNWRSDLPARYSDLRDEHFPLFLTFDRLSAMLENDMEGIDTSKSESTSQKPTRLSYERFLQHYWPHFPQTLTKGLDSAMMFSEIMGVIMGSEETLTGSSFHLSRDAYLNLSERAQSTFADQRERMYTLFESYLNQKRLLGDIDAADRTHTILRYLERGVPGKKVDYLYVDETQDILLIDTLLLRSVCHNPNGLFWAGDTAQTISVGSSFRFNELKAFLYRVEHRRLETTKQMDLHHTSLQPETFQLTVNYRSHAGIVNCASTVIQIITMFWPYAIDVLDRERGTVDGLRPVFFTGFDSGNIEYEQFLFGDREGSYIEFGAQQCILVRDEAAREKLREQVGDIGLIMTLYESKGLEFNDVLLYNFFEDSTVGEAQWRVVLNALDTSKRKVAVPLFDKARHAGVCVELKFLYVAITRARNNVWIADTSSKGEPMRMLWTSKDQVQTCTPGADTPRLAMSSTVTEWEEQGRKLFANKQYRQAKHCFERALLPRQAAVAGAYYLRQEARKKPAGTNRRAVEVRKNAYLTAAAEFVACAQEETTLAYFKIAAECYEEAGDDGQAAQTYRKAKEYTKSTELYRKLGNFDEAVDNIINHKDKIRLEVLTTVTSVARLYYFKEQEFKKANALFSSDDEQLEYLEDRGLDVARATLLESLGRYYDAAEVHLEEGRTFEAIKLFFRDRLNEKSLRRGIECVLRGLWQRVSFGIIPDRDDSSVAFLLGLADKADVSLLSESHRNEVSMFQAVCQKDLSKLELLGSLFEETDPAAAVLCLDHCFTNPPKIQVLQVDDIALKLQSFFRYVKLLNLFTWADPSNHFMIERLFGYSRQGENNFLIPEGTFLHSTLLRQQDHPALFRSPEGNILLDGAELRDLFHRTLLERLRSRVQQENEMCKRTKAFSPCLTYSVFDGSCNRVDCPHEHIPAAQINAQHYNSRVRIHLQQILILKTVQYIDNDASIRRYWISQLYTALYPPFFRLGSASGLDLSTIPEAQAALQVVKEWVRSWVYEFEFLPHVKFLSDLAQVVRLSFQLDRKDAMTYLTQSPFMAMKPMLYLRSGNNYVVGEFLLSSQGQEQGSISCGVLFVLHIMQNHLPIHVSILCDLVEHLCACMVVADRQSRGTLHDLTLPLSWLINWTSVVGQGPRQTHTFNLLLNCMAMLLERLYSGNGADHLLFENRNLATLGGRLRDTFLARICKCICLLGYNSKIADERTRHKILKIITLARRMDQNPHYLALSNKFVTATSWPNVVRALRDSTARSPLDELVVLIHAERVRPRPTPNIRQIVYQSLEDIPLLLGSSRSNAESTLEAEAPAAETEPPEEDDLEEGTAEETQEDFAGAGGYSDELPSDPGPVAMPPALEAVQRTEEEIAAAITIQRAFRRAHWRVEQHKTELAGSTLAAGCAHFFVLCATQAQALGGDGSSSIETLRYRMRFLGPLPHLLLCLDVVHTAAQSHKAHVKKELRDAKHEKLEALDKQLTQLTDALKQVIHLQKALGPSAAVHRACDLAALKTQVSKAVSLMQNLPFNRPEDGLTAHLERAYKGIVQPKAFVPSSAKPKPALNVEDLDLDYY